MSDNNKIKFLLGSNTKIGFVSLFDELRNPLEGKRLYIIKGGPGSGKSSLMKRVLKVLEAKEHSIEYFHCASDPGSLDAYIDYDSGIAMVDGTAPHTMDPRYPGAYDTIINMGDCWDESSLMAYKDEIIQLSDTISSCHQMATASIASAADFLNNNMTMAKPYVKLNVVNDFVRKLINDIKGTNKGKVKKRLLSAVSVGETVFFNETIAAYADKIYVIPDMWGAASKALLSALAHEASLLGLEHIICYCSIRTPHKIDHIIFPSAAIAVTTSNSFHSIKDNKHYLVTNLMEEIPDTYIDRMSLHLNISKELIDLATDHIKDAKLMHDDLEAFYIKAMDFSKVDPIFNRIISENKL
ncbi:MAG: hypothetical protein GX271_04595 [Clostridiales bacterium]|nr:hypothetical protein [Clostridiales bacterium]